jgi:hypothetical protein
MGDQSVSGNKARQTLKRAAKAALVLSVAVYDSFN